MDLSLTALPFVEISVTKIELDKETLVRGRSKLFKGCCAIEQVNKKRSKKISKLKKWNRKPFNNLQS